MNIEAIINVCKFIGEHWTGDDGDKVVESARLIRECRAAGFIDDAGNVRKVLGTLPLTADGCVVGNHTTLWISDLGEVASLRVDNIGCSERDGIDEAFWEAGECYSTRQAAEAAKEQRP